MIKSSLNKSGRRDSNPRPSAWKANALSTELLPHFQPCGQNLPYTIFRNIAFPNCNAKVALFF